MKNLILIFISLILLFSVNINAQIKDAKKDAAFYSQKVEDTYKTGKSYTVSITFKNSGGKTWAKNQNWIIYSDPRMHALNNNVWGVDSVKVKKNVKHGGTYEFVFKITAPSETGIYFFSWQMCSQNGTFGTGSEMKEIKVEK